MGFPDFNVIVGLMLYFEGAAFAEHNLGQSLKQATKKAKREVIKSWQPYKYGFVWEGQKCAGSLTGKRAITRPGPCPLPGDPCSSCSFDC